MSELKTFTLDDRVYETKLTRKFASRKPYVPHNPKKVLAHIPGVIRKVYVIKGQDVVRDERLLVLEAMKMQNDIVAQHGGKVARIHVEAGQMVAKGQVLVEFGERNEIPAELKRSAKE